jgi:multiple sugar transport system ATP-binding protein
VTARLDAATVIREGQDAELWVDTRAIHVFDPANGQNITLEAREKSGRGNGGATAGSGTPAS